MDRFRHLVPLVELTVAVARGEWDRLLALRATHEPDRAFREALLQLHLFVGFPAVVEAFTRLERGGGVGAPEDDEADLEADGHARGRALFGRIYGEHGERVEGVLRGAHPQLCHWVLGHAYGRVLTRPGLTGAERELLAVAALALRGPARQLASHLRGALACGAERADLERLAERLAEADAEGGAALRAGIERLTAP